MAKVTGPLLSMSASGTIGKALVFASRLGQSVVRGWAKPMNPQSDDQAEVRTKLAIPGKVTKVMVSDSTVATEIKAVTAAGQTWNSHIGKEILGASLANYDADAAEYVALDAGEKTLWDTAAAGLGLVSFDLGYGVFGAVTAGEQLYHMAKACFRQSLPSAPTDPEAWVEATINTFAGKLND